MPLAAPMTSPSRPSFELGLSASLGATESMFGDSAPFAAVAFPTGVPTVLSGDEEEDDFMFGDDGDEKEEDDLDEEDEEDEFLDEDEDEDAEAEKD